MNFKRFIFSVLAFFIVFEVLNFVIHNLILSSAYEAIMDIWREDLMSKMWIMHVTTFIMAILFVYIFVKGYEGKGIGEGIRFGLILGLLMNVVGMFNQYAVYPIPFNLALQWFIYGLIQFVICGVVVSIIYKPE